VLERCKKGILEASPKFKTNPCGYPKTQCWLPTFIRRPIECLHDNFSRSVGIVGSVTWYELSNHPPNSHHEWQQRAGITPVHR
jgi:hypothetical protein